MKNNHILMPAFLVLVLGVVSSVWVQYLHNKTLVNAKNSEVALVIANKSTAIQKELNNCFPSVELIQFIFEKQASISAQEFQQFTSAIFQGNSSFTAISWVPKIRNDERIRFESKKRQEYKLPQFSITQLNNKNELIKSNTRPYYFAVEYIEPLTENQTSLGYDIFSNEIRKIAITNAINKDELQITSRIKLVQDTSGYSFLAIMPVIDSSNSINNLNPIENVKGLISTVFKVDELINNALLRTENFDISLVIYDITSNP